MSNYRWQALYEMEMMESRRVATEVYAMRVSGGWIFEKLSAYDQTEQPIYNTIFVPRIPASEVYRYLGEGGAVKPLTPRTPGEIRTTKTRKHDTP